LKSAGRFVTRDVLVGITQPKFVVGFAIVSP
jgi:hypothetical protein